MAAVVLAVLTRVSFGAATAPVSGYATLSAESRAMQDDEFANPGYLLVDDGGAAFELAGANGRSCASCHGQGGTRLSPANIASYPVFDPAAGKPITLQGRIHRCSERRLGNAAMRYDARKALAYAFCVRIGCPHFFVSRSHRFGAA